MNRHQISFALLALALLAATAHAQILLEDAFGLEDTVGLTDHIEPWESDNWATDEYGPYDADFAWDVLDEDQLAKFYGDLGTDTEPAHRNWSGTIDDAGESGIWAW